MPPIDRRVEIVDENGNPINSGNPLPTTSSGGGGGGAVTVANGADVAEGSTTDSAVTGDSAGTVNSHLRGLTKTIGDPTDAAVGDATGTLNAHARQIAALLTGNIKVTPYSSSFIDHSGTLTSSNVAQTVMAANNSRKSLLIQNNSSQTVWINFGTSAVFSQPSIKLEAGAGYVMDNFDISPESISVIGSVTGQSYTAKEMS
jgi:hypothetical protein